MAGTRVERGGETCRVGGGHVGAENRLVDTGRRGKARPSWTRMWSHVGRPDSPLIATLEQTERDMSHCNHRLQPCTSPPPCAVGPYLAPPSPSTSAALDASQNHAPRTRVASPGAPTPRTAHNVDANHAPPAPAPPASAVRAGRGPCRPKWPFARSDPGDRVRLVPKVSARR